MIKVVHNISMPIDIPETEVITKTRKDLKLPDNTIAYIYRRSIDARHKNNIKFIYSIAFETSIENNKFSSIKEYSFNPERINQSERPVIVGMGPAGLFCAYLLAQYGLRPILIERGQPIEQRKKSVEYFWNGGNINPESNVQFGEGGAGAFSDGKLVTRINDPRCRYILELFVHFGADIEILKQAKPHIGTDKLYSIVINIRNEIKLLGGDIYYKAKLTDIIIQNNTLTGITINNNYYPCHLLVLAIGNSARDTYQMLLKKNK